MAVVRVRAVWVAMGDRFVPMPVGMAFHGRLLARLVVVMQIVVAVRMAVFQRLMRVDVIVLRPAEEPPPRPTPRTAIVD